MLGEFPQILDPFAEFLSTQPLYKNQSLYNITDTCRNDCCAAWPDGPNGQPGMPFFECYTPLDVPADAYQDNWVTSNSMQLLDNKPKGKPWFMQVNYVGPHPPFIIMEHMNKSVTNRTMPLAMESNLNASAILTSRRDYTAEVENLDKQFGIMIDYLRLNGEFDNTIICISSDHGEMLGDFSMYGKEKPWIASTNVPLICSGPGVKKGKTVNSYVTQMDLAGTFLDYAQTEREQNMTTTSLRSWLDGTWTDESNEYRTYVSSGLSNWRLVVQDYNATVTWKFVCCQRACPGRTFTNATVKGETKLLFNLKNDPYELNNVASDNSGVVHHLTKLLPPGFCG